MTTEGEWHSSSAGVIFGDCPSISTASHQPSCRLMEFVVNDGPSLSIPCFYCSAFDRLDDYYVYYGLCLFYAISRAVVIPTRYATRIAVDVLFSSLTPANFSAYTNHIVEIHVDAPGRRAPSVYHTDDVDRGITEWLEEADRARMESLEEAGPRRKPATLDSMIDMFMARAELEAKEGEKVESGWVASEHTCTICMEEIESPWESLTPPCSHTFHDTCLSRWLDDNHTCPICRFELPYEA